MRRAALAVVVLLLAPAAAHATDRTLATCFWEGPISTNQPSTRGFDGRNFNFPEESATYWLARLHLEVGTRLELRGRYPHGRYMSVNAYSAGVPTDALSDVRIAPVRGATNPFLPGKRRDRRRRGWRLTVLNEPPPSGERAPNTLYAQPAEDEPIELLYRVYEPDRGRDLTGDTGLPRAVLVKGGSRLTPAKTCETVNDPDRSIPVQTIDPALWRAGTSCRPGHPAFDPPRWERFFNLDYSTLAVPQDCTEAGHQLRLQNPPEQQGGFYSNRDTSYVFAHVSTNFGDVLVIRGRLPVFPRTRGHQKRMGRGQLRFWSLCSGESRVTTRTPDCLADRQVKLDAQRGYTIVASQAAARPRNATRRCGVSWLDLGQGDGAGRSDYAVLIMRNMLVAPDFAQAIQRIPRPGEEQQVMGPYFPDSQYMTRAAFEARGC